jgi:hypothetical protein
LVTRGKKKNYKKWDKVFDIYNNLWFWLPGERKKIYKKKSIQRTSGY